MSSKTDTLNAMLLKQHLLSFVSDQELNSPAEQRAPIQRELKAAEKAIAEIVLERQNTRVAIARRGRTRSAFSVEQIRAYMDELDKAGEPKSEWTKRAAAHFKTTVRTINRKLKEK